MDYAIALPFMGFQDIDADAPRQQPRGGSADDPLAAVAELCGRDVADALLMRLPGIRLYVPKKPGADHVIRRLPPDMVDRLVHTFAGATLPIPRPAPRSREETAAMVDRLTRQGHGAQIIALDLGITEDYVYQLRGANVRGRRGRTRRPD